MIPQVDNALCRLVSRHLPEGTVVRLDAPKPTWQTETPIHAVDLFLFGLRDAGPSGVAPPARGCTLSYLVTARASTVGEEHQLLDVALRALLDVDTIPAEYLPEGCASACVGIADTDPAGLWISLGMPARAGFVATVTAVIASVVGSAP
ncbi:MAG: hypothetical protein JWQ81_3019 [Amycolatopsis sp.]|uniref:Pvc16 family protein n=1 Tax=Amycolatopsis sp. TaxID=37632 RepID=UPI002637947E|nr:Pvc16 family protein [Amycolatopsis sp.]MCU1682280.1 hypothetical protein [Amycolatopsis sp.]